MAARSPLDRSGLLTPDFFHVREKQTPIYLGHTVFWFSVLQPNLILKETAGLQEQKVLSLLVLIDPWKKGRAERSQGSLSMRDFLPGARACSSLSPGKRSTAPGLQSLHHK